MFYFYELKAVLIIEHVNRTKFKFKDSNQPEKTFSQISVNIFKALILKLCTMYYTCMHSQS